jgi:hypothetical protein
MSLKHNKTKNRSINETYSKGQDNEKIKKKYYKAFKKGMKYVEWWIEKCHM